MAKGIIYQALNVVSGKRYIGLTTQGLDTRKHKHFYEARRRNKKAEKTHFQKALNKYDLEAWVWSVLEDNIPKKDLGDREIFYIEKFDTFKQGYNSTTGGEGAQGTAKKHKLYHEKYGWKEMTVPEFSEKYNLSKGTLSQVITGEYRQHKGWFVNEERRDKPFKNKNLLSPLFNKIDRTTRVVHTIQRVDKNGDIKIVRGLRIDLQKEFNLTIHEIRSIVSKVVYKDFTLLATEKVERYYLSNCHRKKTDNYYIKTFEIIE